MKVAVSSTGEDLLSQIDPRFGRCAFFVIVETDDLSFEVFNNENIALSGGAGIQSASFVSSNGIVAVLTGNCGPNAMKALSAGGIEVFTGQTGTVEDAVLRYKTGSLEPSTKATVSEKAGVAVVGASENIQSQRGGGRCMGGTGRGMGMSGGGRGMGMGRSAGMQRAGNQTLNSPSREVSLAELKNQAANLQKQMEDIQMKIQNLE